MFGADQVLITLVVGSGQAILYFRAGEFNPFIESDFLGQPFYVKYKKSEGSVEREYFSSFTKALSFYLSLGLTT